MTIRFPAPGPGEEAHLLPWPMSITIVRANGDVLVHFFETEDGTLDIKIPDPAKLPEAARLFMDQLVSLAGCRIVHIDPVTGIDL